MVSIYTLCDPDSGEVRYVGLTRDTHRRLIAYRARTGGHTKHLRNWLAKIDHNPVLVVLELVDLADADVRERYWITQLRSYAARLLNYTDGGEGGNSPSVEVRDRIRQAQQKFLACGTHNFLKPDVRARVSASNRERLQGKPIPWFAGQTPWNKGQRGGTLTEEHKRKCSLALQGKTHTAATRLGISHRVKTQWADPAWAAMMRNALKGKDHSVGVAASAAARRGIPLTPEHRAKVSAGQAASWTPARRLAASQARKGKVAHPITEAMKAKISASVKAYFAAKRAV